MDRARTLTEKLALTLLERDGIKAIRLLHLAAAGYGHPAAVEALLEIADAAERCLRHAGAVGPRWQATCPPT
jgi:GGDEF domain-containing protein